MLQTGSIMQYNPAPVAPTLTRNNDQGIVQSLENTGQSETTATTSTDTTTNGGGGADSRFVITFNRNRIANGQSPERPVHTEAPLATVQQQQQQQQEQSQVGEEEVSGGKRKRGEEEEEKEIALTLIGQKQASGAAADASVDTATTTESPSTPIGEPYLKRFKISHPQPSDTAHAPPSPAAATAAATSSSSHAMVSSPTAGSVSAGGDESVGERRPSTSTVDSSSDRYDGDEEEEIDEEMVQSASWSDLVPDGVRKKERKFYVDLFSWMERERPDLLPTKLPSLGFHPVDFYNMYRVVTKYGGYEHFNNTHGWSLVHRKMKNYRPTMTSASYRIKKYYRDYLLDYEKAHFTPPAEPPMLREEDIEEPFDVGTSVAAIGASKRTPGRPPKTYKKRKSSITRERKRSVGSSTGVPTKYKRAHRSPTRFQSIEVNIYARDPDVFGHESQNRVVGPLYGDLFDMATGKALSRSLPVKARVTTFGNLFYFELPHSVLPEEEDIDNLDPEQIDLINEQKTFSKNTLKKGEIAYWADQNTFICGYGETPASRHPGEVRLIDFCVSCGRLWDFSLADIERSKSLMQHDMWVTVLPTTKTRFDVLREMGREHLLSQPLSAMTEESDHSVSDSDSMEEEDMGALEEEAAVSLMRFEHEPVVRPKRGRRKKVDVQQQQQQQQQQQRLLQQFPYQQGIMPPHAAYPSMAPTSPYAHTPPPMPSTATTTGLTVLKRNRPTLLLRYRFDVEQDSDCRLFKLDFNDANDPLVREFQMVNNRFIVKPSNILRCLQADEVRLDELVEIRYFEEHPENPAASGWILMRESFQASMPVTDTNAQILQLRLKRGAAPDTNNRYTTIYSKAVHSSLA